MRNMKATSSKSRSKRDSRVVNSYLGHKIKVPSQPPEFTRKPWYHLVVRVSPDASVTQNEIRAAVLDQLGLPTEGLNLEFRLLSVRLWGNFPSVADTPTTGETTLTVLDPFYHATNLTRALCVLTGFPDQVNRVALGYKYSIAQSSLAIDAVSSIPLYRCINAGSTGILYIELLWRTDN